MDLDEMEIDPAVAEAMGFSGFGMQNKKRKHDDEDAFTQTAQSQGDSTTSQVARADEKQSRNSKGKPPANAGAGRSQSRGAQVTTDADGKPTLEALRHGVPNAQGDMVYFLPSFIEDPWERLRGR